MRSNYLVVLVALSIFFRMSDAQGIGKIYTGHGCFFNNCPITTCASLASSCGLKKYRANCGSTSTEPGDCLSCINTLPQNAEWTSNGVLSATGCTWACKADYALSGGQCVLKERASNSKPLPIANSEFKTDGTGAFPQRRFQCAAGFLASLALNSEGRGPLTCTGCAAGTKIAAGETTSRNCPAGTFCC